MIFGGKDDIWTRLTSPTTWAIAGGKFVIVVTREAMRLRDGSISAEQFRVRAGGHLGSSAGIILGAATGAACGSIVPGIGNIAGAFAGGVIGAMAGEEAGRMTASLLEPKIVKDPSEPSDASKDPKASKDSGTPKASSGEPKPNGHVKS